MPKPNYRHQKKQKEEARKLRQAEKQNRRLAARNEATSASPVALTDEAGSPPAATDPAQATP
ncbi:MAG: hypothetical protein ACRES2_03295 [Steroidobacteraceae bacterium]